MTRGGAGGLPPPRNERLPNWTRPPSWSTKVDAIVCSVSDPDSKGVREVHVARHAVWRDGSVRLPGPSGVVVGVLFEFVLLAVRLERRELGRDPAVQPRRVRSTGGSLLELRADEDGTLYARVDVESESWRVPVTRALFDEVRRAADSAGA